MSRGVTIGRVVGVVAGMLVIAGFGAGPAASHDEPLGTDPAGGAAVEVAPDRAALTGGAPAVVPFAPTPSPTATSDAAGGGFGGGKAFAVLAAVAAVLILVRLGRDASLRRRAPSGPTTPDDPSTGAV